jgi:hypothetical protein
MASFQVRVSILCPLATVFAIYTQPDPWSWCSYLHNVRWVVGRPWEVDSRMAMEIDDPVEIAIDQVLTRFEPLSRVDFISHFSGVTLIARMTFRAVSEVETEISGHVEFVGTFSRVTGFAIAPALEQSTRQFLDELKRECERATSQRASGAAKPGS